MTDLNASRRLYDESFGDQAENDIESNGIWDEAAFATSLKDPRSAILDAGNRRLPLLVPIDNLPWVNNAWYSNLTAPTDKPPIYYYSHLPRQLAERPAPYKDTLAAALCRVAAERGIVAYDAPERRAGYTDETFKSLVAQIGGIACEDMVASLQSPPIHYHYEGTPRGLQDMAAPSRPFDFYALYAEARSDNSLPVDHPISVESCLSEDDIQQVWGYYSPAHEELNADDPVYAGFTEPELADVLMSPAFTKLVHRTGGRITHLSLVADVRACPWLNQHYFNTKYPEAYNGGRIICGIGAITDPAAPPSVAPTVRAFAMVARLVARSGYNDVVLPYATDNHSNAYMPTLTQRAMRAFLDVDMIHPTGRQLFRAWRLAQTEQ